MSDYSIFLHSNANAESMIYCWEENENNLGKHHKPDPFTFLVKNNRDVVGLLLLLSHSV